MTSIYRSDIGRTLVLDRYKHFLKQWPVPCKHHHIDTEYGSTFVIESGLSGKPPVLLLHGSVSNSLSWMGDVELLSKTHHVFAVDIIGEAGFSDPNRPTYESGAYAKWLDELSTNLGCSNVAIVGLSLGGWMALDLATHQPERVSHLCLMCTSGIVRESATFVVKALFYMMLGTWGKQRIMKLVNGGKMPEAEGMQEALEFFGLIGQHLRPRTAKLPLFDDKSLRGLKMPMLVIGGENDALIPAEQTIARLSDLAANVNGVLLPDTGHVISGQTRRIAQFLSR